jgi:hypothetical protein
MTKIPLLFLLVLSGCSSFSFYSEVVNSIKVVVLPNNLEITQEFYNDFEYSFVQATFGRSDSVIMVLEEYDRPHYKWVSSDGIRITTNSFGKVVETEGLPNDLYLTGITKENIIDIKGLGSYSSDFYSPRLTQALTLTNLSSQQQSNIMYLGNQRSFTLYEERISIPSIYWNEKNYYWMDGKKIIKTIQTLSPNQSSLELTFYIK